MNVLIISGEFLPFAGGAGTYCMYLTKALKMAGHHVDILTKKYDDPAEPLIDSKLEKEGIGCTRMNYSKMLFLFRWPGQIAQYLKTHQYDFVILNNNIAHLLCSLPNIRKALGNYIVIFHGRETAEDIIKKFCFIRLLFSPGKLRKLYARANALIAVSNNLKEYLEEKYTLERVQVIANCIDTETFYYSPENAGALRAQYGINPASKVLLTASRIVAGKGTDKVLRVFQKVAESDPQLLLIIAGDGPCREELMRQAASLNIAERVIFTGKVSQAELRNLFQICDLFILLSYNESFGLVFLEANACRAPVIGSKIDGIPEAIDDGKSGFLVDLDNEAEIADKIKTIFHNPGLRRIIGEYGERRVKEKFSISTLSAKIDVLLKK